MWKLDKLLLAKKDIQSYNLRLFDIVIPDEESLEISAWFSVIRFSFVKVEVVHQGL